MQVFVAPGMESTQGGGVGTASNAKPFNRQSSFAFQPLELWTKYHVADSLR
jgi:hypothetical protein